MRVEGLLEFAIYRNCSADVVLFSISFLSVHYHMLIEPKTRTNVDPVLQLTMLRPRNVQIWYQ
jgi:hypothetical protein